MGEGGNLAGFAVAVRVAESGVAGGGVGVMGGERVKGHGGALHPNEVDRKRIERALGKRKRYRYVTPQVRPIAGGYQIVSPCCSRNIDPEGGLIDIARLEFQERRWCLSYKDHRAGCWIQHGEYPGLPEVLKLLNEDPERKFWQ